ncbi:Geranylgeranylglyceryl phosphate synthase [uncultured archaeon]|nr:Geranylgeranylglyceryl phosphate synthase [uncultured archaeon]
MENEIANWRKTKGVLHFTLIDPDKQPPTEAGKLAKAAQDAGSDAIMIGGSTTSHEAADATTKAVRESVSVPVILFPGGASGVSRHATHIFFMSLLNSTKRRFLVEEQLKGAMYIRKLGITPIPMGYILISTSETPTTVERVAEPDPIRESDVEKAVAYALTAQYFGMQCVYLEAGSGAQKPVPLEIVSAVKKALSIVVIVGGGIRSPDAARQRVKAGADVIVTGTIGERDPQKLIDIIKAVKEKG